MRLRMHWSRVNYVISGLSARLTVSCRVPCTSLLSHRHSTQVEVVKSLDRAAEKIYDWLTWVIKVNESFVVGCTESIPRTSTVTDIFI